MFRFRNRKLARRAKCIMLSSILLLITTLFLFWAFESAEPLLLPLAQMEFKDMVTETVYECVKGLDLDNIVILKYDSNGKIASLSTDTVAVNAAVSEIMRYLESELGKTDINIEIPVGDIVGDALSLGKSTNILVQLNQYKATKAEMFSEFESAGINQTLHRLTLNLEIETVVLLPGINTEKLTVELSLPVAETLIVGNTPDTYVNTDQTK